MTPEERAEDDRQKRLAQTRDKLLKQSGPKATVGATVKGALSSAMGKTTAAIKGAGGAIAKPFTEVKRKREEAWAEVEGLEFARQMGEQIDPNELA
jgi:hypothetical protein